MQYLQYVQEQPCGSDKAGSSGQATRTNSAKENRQTAGFSNDLHSHLADMVGSRSCIARYVSGSVSVPKTIGRRLPSGSPHNCRVQGFSLGSR